MEYIKILTAHNDPTEILSVTAKVGVKYRKDLESTGKYGVVCESLKSIGFSNESRSDCDSDLRTSLETFFLLNLEHSDIHEVLTNETFRWSLKSIECDEFTYIKDTKPDEYLIFEFHYSHDSEMKSLINTIRNGMFNRYSFELTDDQILEYLDQNKTHDMSSESFDTLDFERFASYLSNRIIGEEWVTNDTSTDDFEAFFDRIREKAPTFGYVFDRTNF